LRGLFWCWRRRCFWCRSSWCHRSRWRRCDRAFFGRRRRGFASNETGGECYDCEQCQFLHHIPSSYSDGGNVRLGWPRRFPPNPSSSRWQSQPLTRLFFKSRAPSYIIAF